MIPRKLRSKLLELAGYYPVVVVTGPRQSGKTTLCKSTYPDKAYVSLESLDTRNYAHSDPRGFLQEYRAGAVIDEIQQVPELLSYLQSEVDSEPAAGRFILTGSQHFGLSQAISQSLAGRCGILTLLAPDLEELSAFPAAPTDLYTMLWQGSYPRIYDREIPAHQWLADYISTYVERDVRQVVNVGDLLAFSGFLKLCAGRTGQEINLSSMGNDAGISHNTARAWLSVLETSYIIHRLPAWHGNIRKQVVKAPKLHFLDSGVACHLLGIRELEQLRHHPLRGALFESWVVAELHKAQLNRGEEPNMFHYRESRGPEIDLLISKGKVLHAIEIKSGATASADFFRNFQHLTERLSETGLPDQIKNHVIYGGEQSQKRTQARLWSWRDTLKVL
jgi:hypothetical protein